MNRTQRVVKGIVIVVGLCYVLGILLLIMPTTSEIQGLVVSNLDDDEGTCFELLIIDEETIDNDISTIEAAALSNSVLPDFLVNDNSPTKIGNPWLNWNIFHSGDIVRLPGGQTGDEGLFSVPPSVPFSLDDFAEGTIPQDQLDNVLGVTPLRNGELLGLKGGTYLAVVYDSDISINFDPLNANLQGDRYGRFAFTVLDVLPPGLPESGDLFDLLVRVEPVDGASVRDCDNGGGPGDPGANGEGVFLTLFCGQNIEVGEQTSCAIHARTANGTSVDDAVLFRKVINASDDVVRNGTDAATKARFIDNGVYVFNFSVDVGGNYAVYTFINNTPFSASTAIFVRELFESAAKDRLEVSGAWFQQSDTIIVDALFMRNSGMPITNANCTLSLKDSQFVEIVTNANMPEHTIGGEPHYTYNATNISVIAASIETGKFFGHVQCRRPNPLAHNVFAEADFEVHKVAEVNVSVSVQINNSALIEQIQETQEFLTTILEKAFDFSQEQVFLVTDSVSSMEGISTLLDNKKITPQQALEEYNKVQQDIYGRLSSWEHSQDIQVQAGTGDESNIITITESPRKNGFFKIISFGVLLGIIGIIVLTFFRRERPVY